MSKKTHEYVKPAKGLIVRYPGTMGALPAEGTTIELTGKRGNYWRRRIKSGDVIIATPKNSKRGSTDGDKL